MIRTLLIAACLFALAGCQTQQAMNTSVYQQSDAKELAQRCLASESAQPCLSAAFPKRCAQWVHASLKQSTYNIEKLANCASTCQNAPALSRWLGACSSII